MALIKISELTAAAALDRTESVEVVQSGNSRRTTVQGIIDSIYPTTPAETDEGVTPVDKSYPAGYVLRYIETFVSGVTDMTAAILAALASAPIVVFPEGVLLVSARIFVPANRILIGAGMPTVVPNTYPTAPTITGGTLIRMVATVGRDTNVLQIGTRDGPSNNVTVNNLGVDFNRARWTVTGGDNDGESMKATAIGIYGSEMVVLNKVVGIDGRKHSIDVSAPSYSTLGPTSYDPQPSRFVWLNECIGYGAGDDNITTHQCSWVFLNDCYSMYPSGVTVPGNSNCVEIDDGSRNIFINGLVSRGGVRGLETKGHSDSAAPYNVHVKGYTGVNNCRGIEARHLGHQSITDFAIIGVNQANDTFTIDDDFTDAFPDVERFVVSGSTGNDGTYIVESVALVSGDTVITVVEEITSATADGDIVQNESPNAFDLFFDDITIVAPKRDTQFSVINDVSRFAINISSYSRVKFGKVTITDGSLDVDNLEFDEHDMPSTNRLVHILNHGRDVSFDELHIHGFSTLARAVWISGSSGDGLYIGRLVGREGPGSFSFFSADTNVDRVYIENYDITASQTGGTSIGIQLAGAISPTNRKFLGAGTITGYDTLVTWNTQSWSNPPAMGLPGPLALPASSTTAATFNVPHGTAPSSPQNGDIWTTTTGVFARINGTTVQLATV